jgi:hypothetical protein
MCPPQMHTIISHPRLRGGILANQLNNARRPMACGTRMAPVKSSTAMLVAPPSHRSEIMPLERTNWGVRGGGGGKARDRVQGKRV